MTWLYVLLEPASPGNRLAMLIAGLRVIGIFGFAFLTGYFVIQDSASKDHIGSHGFGLDRSNNGSSRSGARTLFVAGCAVLRRIKRPIKSVTTAPAGFRAVEYSFYRHAGTTCNGGVT